MGKSCCFTGHRPGKLPDTGNDHQELKDALLQVILGLVEEGFTDFYTGMAPGVDLFCGEIVADLLQTNQKLSLITVLPFSGQGRGLFGAERRLFDKVLTASSYSVVISQEYTLSCMQQRNVFMVDNSNCVLAVFAGIRGGTKNTLDYARKLGKRLLVLSPDTLCVMETAETEQLSLFDS